MYIVNTKRGYHILYDKQTPPHKDLMRFISHSFDTYRAMNEIYQPFFVVDQVQQ